MANVLVVRHPEGETA